MTNQPDLPLIYPPRRNGHLITSRESDDFAAKYDAVWNGRSYDLPAANIDAFSAAISARYYQGQRAEDIRRSAAVFAIRAQENAAA